MVLKQYELLKKLGVKTSYSFKTNREVGKILEEATDSEFSIHLLEETGMIKNKKRIWFFAQAWSKKDIGEITKKGVRKFVVDNEKDLQELLGFLAKSKITIDLALRMQFHEHRVSSGRYFAYGMPSSKVNGIISEIKDNPSISRLGVHIHRKSQNTSEWEIKSELLDSLASQSMKRINFVNLGGGLPVQYKSYTAEIMPYIFNKIKEAAAWLHEKGIEAYIEPGRFVAAPAVKLETGIIQIYSSVIVVNTSLYNCALDTLITETKMLVENELADYEKGEYYLIKGNSPTRDDIFRYKVKLKQLKVGDKIVFLNAGAYNYTTDFCGFRKLKTEIVD
ncbi:decarboxylase [Candidatus Pacearchaeota archaeon]|nr:decarboxylase [Candidatus Pacearchaeota archaeon]